MHTLLAAVLAAAPAFIEPWGLALEAKDGKLVVAAVRPGSPAETAKVTAGAQLFRIADPQPRRPGAMGTLDADALADVTATLREKGVTQLVLAVSENGSVKNLALNASPFKFKSGEELKKLSPTESARYYAEVSQQMYANRPRSNFSAVYFEPERVPFTLWLDPATGKLTHASRGGATGTYFYAHERVHFTCPGTPLEQLKVKTADVASPAFFDIGNGTIQGYSKELAFPVLKLGSVEKCPGKPLVIPVELEVTCKGAAPVQGREKLRVAVKCEKPPQYTQEVFAALPAWVNPNTVGEGTPTVDIRPPFDRGGGPVANSISMVVFDAAGKEVARLKDVWVRKGDERMDAWEQKTLPVPKAPGKYTVRNEGRFADGSTLLGGKTALIVQTKAEWDKEMAEFEAGSRAFFALQERIKTSGIDLCDLKKALPWVKAQPEVESVAEHEQGQWSYLLKSGRPVAVHCHRD
jgi:hypothetical protein